MATGVDDEMTLRANRDGFQKFELRPRRLVDVSKVDMGVEIFGAKFDSPIVVAPTGSNRAFHPDAEIAVAKAARLGNHLQILSTVATTSIEDAIAARGAPVWFQLYTTQKWEIAEALVKRAESAGAPAIAVTLDVRSSAKWETFVRLRRTDTRDCGSCHGLSDYLSRKPNFSGIELGGVSGTAVTNLTWDTIKRLRDRVKVRLVLKGILTSEDARLAADAGIDGIVVSNHGGRVEDGVGATITLLPEIVEAVGNRMPILVDSGFRRGSDIVKALAIGARAVCVGRPYLWGLGAFGQPGVRARARHSAQRDAHCHAATRRALAQGPYAGDGPAHLMARVYPSAAASLVALSSSTFTSSFGSPAAAARRRHGAASRACADGTRLARRRAR
jgi:isopentenyl diphosphate isomerase/L-lactate dehydrogenase-like FMN-dependent dehydrogenase